MPFLVGRSSTAATFQSRCACLPAALLVVCYPERCDELSRVGVYSHPWKYDARRAPTTNKSPPSRAARLVGSRIIEDHISVGQARNIANADKVCGAPLQRLAHMDAQRLACFFSHLARREGLKFELQRRQDHAHAMGQRQLPQCPTVARSRHARQCCRRRPCRVDISFEGRYRERSANVRRRRVEANHTAGIRFEVAAHSRLCYGGAMCPARA